MALGTVNVCTISDAVDHGGLVRFDVLIGPHAAARVGWGQI